MRTAKTEISLGVRPVWSEYSLSTWRNLGYLATHWAHSKDSDLTGRMPRLIWVFAERTSHFVGFVMRWPICLETLKVQTRYKQWINKIQSPNKENCNRGTALNYLGNFEGIQELRMLKLVLLARNIALKSDPAANSKNVSSLRKGPLPYQWNIIIKHTQSQILGLDNVQGSMAILGQKKRKPVIRKPCLYNFDPVKPHFYIVKLGLTGVYIIFVIFAQKT